MQKGDVLFGKRRAYQRKVAIAPFDGIFSAHGMVLRPNRNLSRCLAQNVEQMLLVTY